MTPLEYLIRDGFFLGFVVFLFVWGMTAIVRALWRAVGW